MNEFLHDVTPLAYHGFKGIALTAEYDQDLFEPLLFDQLGIERPPAIASTDLPRQASYLAGRRLLKEAFFARKFPVNAPIGIGRNGEPLWPVGIKGSISHNQGWVCCAVSTFSSYAGVGINVLPMLTQTNYHQVERQVLSAQEQELYRYVSLSLSPEEWLSVVYSAKVTVFKTLHPLFKLALNVTDIALDSIDSNNQRLVIRLLQDVPTHFELRNRFAVRFSLRGDHVITLMHLK